MSALNIDIDGAKETKKNGDKIGMYLISVVIKTILMM